jgi:hypothetical protein
MKSLHADTGDYVLVDVFMSLLDDNEDRVCLALDELIELSLAVVTPDKDALAMTKAGQAFRPMDELRNLQNAEDGKPGQCDIVRSRQNFEKL